jgi:hypothetical protein
MLDDEWDGIAIGFSFLVEHSFLSFLTKRQHYQLVIPDVAPAEFRNLAFGFQRLVVSSQQKEIDSCIRRNDGKGMQE